MTNTRKKQIKTIGILLVAVIGLTIGFSAFSSSLLMKTRLTVNPEAGTFNVKFSNASDKLDESGVIPTKSSDIFTAYNGVIDNSGIPTIANLGGEFTQPGETITYDFYTLNTGENNAYLTDIIFNNVEGESVNKKCTSVDGTNQTAVDLACNSISIKLIMGNDKITGTRSIVGHELLPDASEPVRVVIEYASTGVLPEVEFDVEFGSISMIYSSLEGGNTTSELVDDSSCFAVEAKVDELTGETYGVITSYDFRCGTDVVIPSRAYVTEEIKYGEFNTDRCMAIAINPESSCPELKTKYDNNEVEDEDYEMIVALFTNREIKKTNIEVDIKEIGEDAFVFSGLTSVTIQNGITTIGKSAFTINNITSVVIPDSVETIGSSAFQGNLINSLTLGSNITEIGSYAFYYNNLASITIPRSLTTIQPNVFASNLLTSLTIPDSITSIGEHAFNGNLLTEIEIPNSVTSIGTSAFRNNSLTRVEIGNGITNIGNYAFGYGEYSKDDVTYGENSINYVKINVPSSNASNLNIDNSTFKWANGYSNSNIVWSDSE